jgi:hypothetical protein
MQYLGETHLEENEFLNAAQQSISVHRIPVMNGIAPADLRDLPCWS